METPTLLIVDDEEHILSSLTRSLRDLFSILTASSGSAALEILSHQKIDLILTDERMPGMTGVEMLAQASRIQPETIGVIITAYTDIGALTTALNLGNVRGYIPKPWDIDELRSRLLEVLLKQSEYFIQQVLDTTPDGITIYDLAKKCNIYVNRGAQEMLGYSFEEIKQMHGGIIHHLATQNEIKAVTEHMAVLATTQEEGVFKIQYQYQHGNGEQRYMTSWDRVFRRNADGRPRLILGTIRDVTQSWMAEQALHQANSKLEAQKKELTARAIELKNQNVKLEIQKKQLVDADRLKTSFITNMSHELRTPLSSVIALSGVLCRSLAKQIPEEEHRYLEVIERNGRQLLTVVNDILDFSRVDAGYEEIDISQFDLSNLVTEVVSIISPIAKQKNIELLHHPNPDLLRMISDATKCRQILQNLVNNAVKFTDTGQVEITLQQKNSSIQIIVSDTGIGISKDHLPFIFDEFRQADSSTSRRFGGTGLGLAIAKKYAQMLGGRISVTSTPGEGSVFTLTLPLEINNEPSASMEESENFEPTEPAALVLGGNATESFQNEQGMRTILLVEDSEVTITQLKDILEDDKYHILVAHNVGEALEIIQFTPPDAMILDLMIPGVDGIQAFKALRNALHTRQIPVIALTASGVTTTPETILSSGFDGYIAKPINPIELDHTIQQVLYGKE